MAEAPRASTICPLNKLFRNLAKSLNEDDVNEMKNLLRGKQVSREDVDKLRNAWDVFHHLKEHGHIDGYDLDLLVQLFEEMGKEPLKERVRKFQREPSATTDSLDYTSASVSSRGKASNQISSEERSGVKSPKQRRSNDNSQYLTKEYTQSSQGQVPRMTGKVNVVIDEHERRRQELDLEEKMVTLNVKKELLELVRKYINSVPENDTAKLAECMKTLKECGADLSEVKKGSLFFILSFLTEEDLDYFWQKYKDGTVDKALTSILIPTDIEDKAERAGITIRIEFEIDEKEYEEVKHKMHEMAVVSSECRASWHRDTVCGKWEAFVMDQVQDKQQAKKLLEQSKFDPVVDALRQEEFFFPSLVSFWLENSYTLPATVTKATEYAVVHYADMYCKENNVKVVNLSEILRVGFNDIGKCLYDHITAENLGKLYPSWIDKSISTLESHCFGMLTKSDDCYTFPNKYVYSYIIAMYLSNIVALLPNNIPMILREEKRKLLQANLSYCFPYVTGILGEKSSYYLKEVVKFCEMQTSIDINNLGLVGNCLFESERPYVFARDIEEVIDRNYTLDLSSCKGISNKTIHALAVILQYTSFIKDIKLYSESDEAFLSSEFKECLTNIIGDPSAIDRCRVRINNSHDFTVTTKLLRVLPLLCIHAASRSGSGTTQQSAVTSSGSDTTQQPAVTSVTISSNVSILEEIEKCTMKMFIKALSCMPHFEKLSLTGLGENLCEQFLLCLSEGTVSLNIKTLCLAGNGLSWRGCQLLLQVLNAMPYLCSLDLSRNNIGSLECTVLLSIKDKVDVSVGDNDIAKGLLKIMSLCTSTAQLQDVGDLTLKSLDDVASLIRNLENVRHIDCTKLINSQLSKLCQNLSLLSNVVSIDVSGIELDKQIVLLLCERLKHLKELQKVDLSHCCCSTDDLQVLLQQITPEVTDLNLSGMNMSGVLLTELKRFRNLKHLNLSNSNLKADDHVFRFIPTSVTHLNLSQNDFHEGICENLENYTQLEELDLSYNKLSHVDIKKILKLISTSITVLNVSHNNLKKMEESFERLTQLRQLDLSNIGLDSCIYLSLPSSMTDLNLSHNQISYIGRKVNHLLQLISLDVSHNQITYIRNSFNNLSQLTHLDVSRNQITDIGQSFTQLTKLTHLDVSHNRIVDIGQGFNHVSQLTLLNVSHNQIIDIGQSFNHLTKLTHLDVSHNQITYIGQSVNHLSQLTHLDVSHNKINQSLNDILKYLPTTVRYLDFSSNNIEDVASVGNVISSFNDLYFINLGSNKFNDFGIQNLLDDIRSIDMVKIGVSHNFTLMPHIIDQIPNVSINLQQDNLRLSDIESSSIFDNLMQVTEVNLSGLSKKECSGICNSFVLLSNLTKLVMTECSLTNVQTFITSLKHLNALTDLDLSKNQLDSATLDHIIRFLPSTLISLSLSHNMANREFSLKHLTKLVRLNLSHNNLKLPLYSLLLNVPERLKYLDISFNKIQNVDEVGKMICDLSQLCYINMNANQIGAVGVQKLLSEIENYDINFDIHVSHNLGGLQKLIPYIANKLPSSAILPDFERQNLTLKDEHLQVFFKNISEITTVEIPKNVEWSDPEYKNVLNHLSVFSNLESLTLALLNPTIFLFLAEILKHFSYLTHLDISGSKIDNQGVKVVGNALLSLERLAYINFSDTNIGMSDIKFLLGIQRQHTSKPFINVASNVHFVQAIFSSIEDQLSGSSIEGIDFDSDELHVISFTNIVQMTQLTNVAATWKHWTDKDFEDFLQWLKYLNPELLDLSNNNIGDIGAKSLSKGMRSMHKLTHLDLSHNNIGDGGAKNLSEGMRSRDGLTHLDLSYNKIGDRGAEILSEGMRSMHKLTHLDLGHNNIGKRGIIRLSEVMTSMHGLTHLDLSNNNIGDRGVESLSEGMRSMHKLTHLDLSHNNIGERGGMRLSEVMTSMHGLTRLDLSYNNMGHFGAMILSESMRSMHGLTHLDLSHNNIRGSGAWSLSEGMRSMHGLTHLDLSHNNIGDSGAWSLSEGMRSMHGLTHLDLSHNNIGDSDAHRLSEGLRSMRRFTHLDLSHNNTRYSSTKSYGEGISSMTSLEENEAASEKVKATYQAVKSSIAYSKEGQHSKEMSYHRAQHTEQTFLPSSPHPSTSGYVPPTEKDPAKS